MEKKEYNKMSRRGFIITGSAVLALLAAGSGGVGYLLNKLNRLGVKPDKIKVKPDMLSGSTLFRRYPVLIESIPWTPIRHSPTPVIEWEMAPVMEVKNIWVKCDNLTSPAYGGNKVRKLEHLLADAMLRERKSIITIGGLGSNHALATAIHGKTFGFDIHLCLFDQPVTSFVRRNLRGFLAAGARIHHSHSMKDAYLNARRLFKSQEKEGRAPYFILSGGTCGLSNVGYVNAAMELAEQIQEGLLPVPDKIFVAAGTCGTISGLIAGLKIAGLPTKVMGIRVVDSFPAYKYFIRYYAQKVADHLHKHDFSVPRINIRRNDFELLTGYLGEGYGVVTPEGEKAVEMASPEMNLETTYTGKTLAACLDYCTTTGKNEKILFWNTYNSAIFPEVNSTKGLPEKILHQLTPTN